MVTLWMLVVGIQCQLSVTDPDNRVKLGGKETRKLELSVYQCGT